MAKGVRLRVWGDYACFTRPEMKVERVSYDVITPSAARGILEAVYWKPAIRWIVERIQVLKPIRFTNIRRNEVAKKIPVTVIKKAMKANSEPLQLFVEDERQQRAALVLQEVEYIISARFEFTGPEDNNEGKHLDIFNRRARKGQCYQTPYLGCREFPAGFELWQGDYPPCPDELKGTKDLGWMLHDLDYSKDMRPHFFRPEMKDGVVMVDYPPWLGSEAAA